MRLTGRQAAPTQLRRHAHEHSTHGTLQPTYSKGNMYNLVGAMFVGGNATWNAVQMPPDKHSHPWLSPTQLGYCSFSTPCTFRRMLHTCNVQRVAPDASLLHWLPIDSSSRSGLTMWAVCVMCVCVCVCFIPCTTAAYWNCTNDHRAAKHKFRQTWIGTFTGIRYPFVPSSSTCSPKNG